MADVIVFAYVSDMLFKLQNALVEVEDKSVIFRFHLPTLDFHLIYGGKPRTFFCSCHFSLSHDFNLLSKKLLIYSVHAKVKDEPNSPPFF